MAGVEDSAAVAGVAPAESGSIAIVAVSAAAAGGANSADTDTERQRGSHDNRWETSLKEELRLHGGVMGLLKAWKNTWSTADQLAYLRQSICRLFPVTEPFVQSPFASLPSSSTVKGLVHPQPS